MDMKTPNYKVTYLSYLMVCAFVRIADDAILFNSPDEKTVILYAEAFCCGSNGEKTYYIE